MSHDAAVESWRQKLHLETRRGVVVTMSSSSFEDEASSEATDESRSSPVLRPGVLPGGSTLRAANGIGRLPAAAARNTPEEESALRRLREMAQSRGVSRDAPDNSALQQPHEAEQPRNVSNGPALQRLREVAQQDEHNDRVAADFRRNMAALRSLGRLMEAVYIRPGSRAPEADRILALRQLAAASRELARKLLEIVGHTSHNGYAQAMAMDAVIDLVARSWEDRSRDDEEENPHWLSERPLGLIRAAATNPEIVQAATELAEKTWNPVRTQEQYREVLAIAAHKSYWRLYMLGEYVNGMDEERCKGIALRLMQYLQNYPHPRGENADMRTSWMSASMGRLTSLVCAELKGRFAALKDSDQCPTDKEIQECVDVAITGFEGIEEHAAKLLEAGETLAERAVDRPTAGA